MYTITLAEKLLLDVKFQPGLFWVIEEYKLTSNDPSLINEGTFKTTSLIAFSTGLSLRHNFARRWSWMTLLDYNNGVAPGVLVSGRRLHTLSLNLGVAIRI